MTEEHKTGRRAHLVDSKLVKLAIGVVVLVIAFYAFYPQALLRNPIYQYIAWRWISDRDRHVQDIAGALVTEDLPRFEQYMRYIVRESDVDIRIVFVPNTRGKTIEQTAVDMFDEFRIGKRTGDRRGLLILYDMEGKRLKVEVGYGLEGYFPDAFVSYLVHDHAEMFFQSGDLSVGLRLMLRLLQHRIREAVIGNDFDPRAIERLEQIGYLSGGAGTATNMPLGSGARVNAAKAADASAGGFNAKDTPEETYSTYLEWLAQGRPNANVDILTPTSRQYEAGLPISRAYADFIFIGEYGKSYRIVRSGNRAVLYFTGTPFVSPHFFVNENGKWRMDLIAEVNNTREYSGGVYTWGYYFESDPYTAAFSSLLSKMGGFWRFTDGDNRPLTIRGDK